MVQGSMLVVILVIAIILMVLLISKLKFHPFVALFAVALAIGVLVGTFSSVFIATPIMYDINKRKVEKPAQKK